MDLLERFPRAWCDTCQKVQAARGAAAALAGAFYHSVLLLLPHAVGWRGCARAGCCPTSRTLADELEFLIRTQWLTESEAANRRAVKCAIARVVTQN